MECQVKMDSERHGIILLVGRIGKMEVSTPQHSMLLIGLIVEAAQMEKGLTRTWIIHSLTDHLLELLSLETLIQII